MSTPIKTVPMTGARWRELNSGLAGLTAEEKADGWHFCADWDHMLIHPADKEAEVCTCKPARYVEAT